MARAQRRSPYVLRADPSPLAPGRPAARVACHHDRMHGSLLAVSDLRVAYGRTEVLFGVSLEVPDRSLVCVMGRSRVPAPPDRIRPFIGAAW